jgi:hypothetical protein
MLLEELGLPRTRAILGATLPNLISPDERML